MNYYGANQEKFKKDSSTWIEPNNMSKLAELLNDPNISDDVAFHVKQSLTRHVQDIVSKINKALMNNQQVKSISADCLLIGEYHARIADSIKEVKFQTESN